MKKYQDNYRESSFVYRISWSATVINRKNTELKIMFFITCNS